MEVVDDGEGWWGWWMMGGVVGVVDDGKGWWGGG